MTVTATDSPRRANSLARVATCRSVPPERSDPITNHHRRAPSTIQHEPFDTLGHISKAPLLNPDPWHRIGHYQMNSILGGVGKKTSEWVDSERRSSPRRSMAKRTTGTRMRGRARRWQSAMEQSKIWAHFQDPANDGFRDAAARYQTLVALAERQVPRGRALNLGIGGGGVERGFLDHGWTVASLESRRQRCGATAFRGDRRATRLCASNAV